MHYDTFDIAEAYWIYYALWHSGGLTARCARQGRSIAQQLAALNFRPAPGLSLESLTENGREIYDALVARYEEVAA